MGDAGAGVVVGLAGAIEGDGAGREDFANPIGGELEERCVGKLGEALAAPAGEIGHEDLIDDMDLGLVQDDPPAGTRATATPERGAEVDAQAGRGGGVAEGRPRADDELAIHDLPDEILGERQQVLVGGWLLCGNSGHGPKSTRTLSRDGNAPVYLRGMSATSQSPELIPARMLNEYAYCPRLAYLEWVQGDFRDSMDTVDGRYQHRRVDRGTGKLPDPPPPRGQDGDDGADAPLEEERPKLHARSVLLSAPRVGLVARIDLVEAVGRTVTPVDYKRGTPPEIPEGAWEPERVQLCAQALILEENGYTVGDGVLYFVAAKRRVPVVFDDILRARTAALLRAMREMANAEVTPAPLVDSPKCPRCSLVGICLPDEVNYLRGLADENAEEHEVRRLLPARDDALPLYVQEAGARVGKRGDELSVTSRDGTTQTSRLVQTSQVSLFGGVQVTTQAVQALAGRGVPICYFTHGGWFYGLTTGMTHKNVELRRLQFRASEDPAASLALARCFVATKIRNARTLLRRNGSPPDFDLARLKEWAEQAEESNDPASLLGIEGSAARLYFQHFPNLIKEASGDDSASRFDFDGRNRRPPKDPINALLSFVYAILAKDLTTTLLAVGFDPFLGFFHRPRYGRPALALDLMEEFRPLVADSTVITAVNTGVVRPNDFVRRGGGVTLTEPGRVRVLRAYERRMDEFVTHPIFGYRISYRRVLEVQARLLARYLAGEIPSYPGFLTR